MTGLEDLFGRAPAPAVAVPDMPPGATPKPWPFAYRDTAGRMVEVLPERRIGDPADSEGEWVILSFVGDEGPHKPGASIRVLLHGGPAWRHRIEGADAIASCDAAPHIRDTLPAAMGAAIS